MKRIGMTLNRNIVLPLLLLACAVPVAGQDAERRRPNLVFILADQLRYPSLGYAGDRKARTPHIDLLSDESVSFRNYVVNTPVCAAFRATLFTGKYASSTGMVINELRMKPDPKCLGHVLTRGGYRTGYIGKWHLWANVAGRHGEVETAFVPPGEHRLGFDGFWAAFNFNHRFYEAYYFRDTPRRVDVKGYEPDVQTDLAIEFIKEAKEKDEPFALFLSYGTPHDPWVKGNVPEKYHEMFRDVEFPLPESWSDVPDKHMDRNTDPKRWLDHWKPNLEEFQRVYYAMTANLDWNVGRLLQTIDLAGLREETVVVFTSDHGEMFGAHGRVFKLTFYEEACRVPLLIRWSGTIPAGSVSDACMSAVDILPTLLSLMKLPVPDGVEGMDVSHLALGVEGREPDAAFLQGMGHTFQWRDGFEWRALRDKRYTYAVYRVDGSELLFDNQADPRQLKDLAGDPTHRATLERLREALRAKRTELGDTFEKCTWYREHWTKDRVILRGAKG